MDKNDFNQLGFPTEGEGGGTGITRELDSITASQELFLEGRGADSAANAGDKAKSENTRMMDSVIPPDEAAPPQNPVRKRKKHKKKKHRTNHTRTMGHVFLGVILSTLAICAGVFLAWKAVIALKDYTGMAKDSREADVEITEDMGVSEIAEVLYDNGIIEMPWLFKAYINLADAADGFLNGEYTVSSGMSYSTLVTTLKTVRTYTNTVTVMIPEGSTAQEIGELLEENLVCRAEDFAAYYRTKLEKYDFEEQITVTDDRFYALEGYLFPDTYEFYVIDDLGEKPDMDTSEYAKQAAEKMYANFESKITKSMYARAEELGMTMDEVITLASIIQKEGTNEDNMAIISSVFHNRLADPENFPNLQTDTTEYYIKSCIEPTIPANSSGLYDGIIAAYDTYTCEGLPEGPICNPGIMAINAALYPAETDYCYFLSSSDGNFYYAETIEKHEQNIIDAALYEDEEE